MALTDYVAASDYFHSTIGPAVVALYGLRDHSASIRVFEIVVAHPVGKEFCEMLEDLEDAEDLRTQLADARLREVLDWLKEGLILPDRSNFADESDYESWVMQDLEESLYSALQYLLNEELELGMVEDLEVIILGGHELVDLTKMPQEIAMAYLEPFQSYTIDLAGSMN